MSSETNLKQGISKEKKEHTLWKRYIETKEGKYYTEYCRTRNQVCIPTRRIQKEFEMKLATEAKSNPKAVWKYMNSKTNNPEGVSDLKIYPNDPKSRLTDSHREKADVLGRYFQVFFL